MNTEKQKVNRSCSGITERGQRCSAHAMANSEYCFFHNPEKNEEREAARRAGGLKNRPATLPATTPDAQLRGAQDVTKLLGDTINQVRRGEIDPKVANAVGYLAGQMLRAIDIRIAFLNGIGESERAFELAADLVKE